MCHCGLVDRFEKKGGAAVSRKETPTFYPILKIIILGRGGREHFLILPASQNWGEGLLLNSVFYIYIYMNLIIFKGDMKNQTRAHQLYFSVF